MPPVATNEAVETFDFMEVAEESKFRGGAAVTLESVLATARAAHAAGGAPCRTPFQMS